MQHFFRFAETALSTARYLELAKVANAANAIGVVANGIVSAISIGIDVHSIIKGYICEN